MRHAPHRMHTATSNRQVAGTAEARNTNMVERRRTQRANPPLAKMKRVRKMLLGKSVVMADRVLRVRIDSA